jgi:hypothetical protein
MDARVKAWCDTLAKGMPRVMRNCISQEASETLASMFDQIDTFCAGHAENKHCAGSQEAALMKVLNFHKSHPMIEQEKCMSESLDDHGQIDYSKTYLCLVGEGSIQ